MKKQCSQIAFWPGKRSAFACCVLLFLFFSTEIVLSPPQSFAKLSVATVQSEGIGTSKSDAITDALIQAISKVNGAQIASQMASSVKESFRGSESNSEYSYSENFQNDVQLITKGVVRNWRILNASRSAELDGLWVAKLEVNVSKYKASKQLKRLRMAIVPFRIGQNISQKNTATQFRKNFTRQLENYLTQSRRFAMLDREFISEQSDELSFVSSGYVKVEEMARLGNRVGTDYIIVGEVEDANVISKERKMQTSDKSFVITRTSGQVSYRIIDVASTQIKFSETVHTSVSGDAITKAAYDLADTVGETILNAIYPVRVVSGTPTQVTLGQGGQTIQKDREYNIVKLGKRIVDPYTKESIGREEIIVGTVEIIDVQAKSSTARIISSHEDLSLSIKNMSLIIRPLKKSNEALSSQDEVLSKKVNEVVKSGKESIKKIEQNSADDW